MYLLSVVFALVALALHSTIASSAPSKHHAHPIISPRAAISTVNTRAPSNTPALWDSKTGINLSDILAANVQDGAFAAVAAAVIISNPNHIHTVNFRATASSPPAIVRPATAYMFGNMSTNLAQPATAAQKSVSADIGKPVLYTDRHRVHDELVARVPTGAVITWPVVLQTVFRTLWDEWDPNPAKNGGLVLANGQGGPLASTIRWNGNLPNEIDHWFRGIRHRQDWLAGITGKRVMTDVYMFDNATAIYFGDKLKSGVPQSPMILTTLTKAVHLKPSYDYAVSWVSADSLILYDPLGTDNFQLAKSVACKDCPGQLISMKDALSEVAFVTRLAGWPKL